MALYLYQIVIINSNNDKITILKNEHLILINLAVFISLNAPSQTIKLKFVFFVFYIIWIFL